MENKKEMTIPNVSAATDAEQSLSKCTDNSMGKSFMMAQLAYHISTGTPLWEYKVRKATVLYFALEDDYPRLQKRLFQMFGAKETGNLYFATECKTVNGGLEEQIRGFMR